MALLWRKVQDIISLFVHPVGGRSRIQARARLGQSGKIMRLAGRSCGLREWPGPGPVTGLDRDSVVVDYYCDGRLRFKFTGGFKLRRLFLPLFSSFGPAAVAGNFPVVCG